MNWDKTKWLATKLPPLPAIVLITLSSVSEDDYFCTVWNVNLLKSFNLFYASEKSPYFILKTFIIFMPFEIILL
jgi:hypothetical protein